MPPNRPGPFQRLFFAAIGLVAGNAALLIFWLCNALRLRAFLLHARIGAPDRVLTDAMGIFVLYAIFSIAGWVFVGVPIALVIPARLLSRVRWPLCVLIGAALGPLALLVIFVLLGARQGTLSQFSLAHTEALWPLSILVSTVSFLVYAALLRWRAPNGAP